MEATTSETNSKTRLWYVTTILFIIFDYGRPQALIPVIGSLRPMLLLTLLLGFFLLKSDFIKVFSFKQVKYMCLIICLLACFILFARNNYYAYKTTLAQLLYMPFILSVVCTVDTMNRLKRIVFIFICLMIYVSIYSLFHGGVGPGNYFADENDLSLYVNMWLPFCYFLYFSENRKRVKLIYLLGLIIGVSAVVISFSRGGFVGLSFMAIVAWLFSHKKIVTLVAVLLVVILMLNLINPVYWEEMATVTDTNESTASERIESWKSAWSMFLDHPLGVGGNNFQVLFQRYQGEALRRNMWGRVAHSLWFTLIPEWGIIGIYLYLALLWTNLKDIFWLKSGKLKEESETQESRYCKYLGEAFIASLAGYFASATFVSVLYYAHYWYLTGLIVAAVSVAKLNVSTKADA